MSLLGMVSSPYRLYGRRFFLSTHLGTALADFHVSNTSHNWIEVPLVLLFS